MANLNKVMLIGNLTRDPEVKYTPKGSAVADVGLAINRYFTLDSGEKREETTFVDVEFWGRTAELAGQYLKKGSAVFVEGRLRMDSWEDKNTGQKRSRLKVVVETMQFLDRRGGGGDEGGGGHSDTERSAPSRPQARQQAAPQRHADPSPEGDDDIPF